MVCVGGVDVLCCCWSEAVMFMEQHGYRGGLVLTWCRCGLGFWGGVFLRWSGWVAVGDWEGRLAV